MKKNRRKKSVSRDDYAALMTDRLRKAGVQEEIVYDSKNFSLRLVGVGEKFLGNTYKEYCLSPPDLREKVLNKSVRVRLSASRPMPTDFADAKCDLRPVIRTHACFANQRLEAARDGLAPTPYQVVGEHFGAGLVFDWPEMSVNLNQTHLDAWGVSFNDAMEIAKRNLEETTPKVMSEIRRGEQIYLFQTDDAYDSARLLLPEMLRRYPVKGELIAAVPSRDILIIAGSDDEVALSIMVALMKQGPENPHPISGIALRLVGDTWVPWMPAASHPCFDEFRECHLVSLAADYAQQEQPLARQNAENGIDEFTATFMLSRAPEEGLFSSASWTKGITSTLPKVDTVAFVEVDENLEEMRARCYIRAVAKWDQAIEVVGHLMEPMDIYPPRFRVNQFPSEEQLKAMGFQIPLAALRRLGPT